MKTFDLKGKELINGTLTVKFPDNFYDKEMYLNQQLLHRELMEKTKTIEKQLEWFKEQLLLVEPPIKGEITKGKLKWRGIKLCQTKSDLYNIPFQSTTYWVEQRGNKIGVEYVEQFNLVTE